MSRSYKKENYVYSCNTSCKKDKKITQKKFRRIEHVKLKQIELDNEISDFITFNDSKEISGQWCWSTDGKRYFSDKKMNEIYSHLKIKKIRK